MKLKLAVTALLISLIALYFVISKPYRGPVAPVALPVPTSTPTPTPTSRPLTFAEMNQLYGPCTYTPTLMYHHIQSSDEAKANKSGYLSVSPENFRAQMESLRQRGFTPIKITDLINFFNSGVALPKKSVLITLDDGYEDNFLNAFPILREFNYPATIFMITGLADNFGYLKWSQISSLNSSGLIYLANHTWSHKFTQKEVTLADQQLAEHGLNQTKVFAFPYGTVPSNANSILNALGYQIAFTTKPGSTLCQKQRLILPRLRVGNSPTLPF